MLKRICDKCGKEIGNDEAFIKIYAPNGNEHSQECVDLCGDCLRKFHEWMKHYSQINLTKEELLSFKGISKRSAEEIVTKLAEKGIHLKGEK